MKTRIGLFIVLAWVCLGCGARGQRAPVARDERAFQTAVDGYARGNIPDARIVDLFTRLSEQGDPRATLWLARLHWSGRCGLQQEPGIAYNLAEPVIEQVVKLAEGGDHEAQFLVGCCHHEGFVLKRSPVEAAKWYAKAVEGKQLSAYGNLAVILAEGEGVEADIEQARKLLKEGAGLGSRYCQFVQAQYAPPDPKSMSRMPELRRNKVAQSLGMKTDAAVRMLAEAGVITDPDEPIDYASDGSSCLEFEDDGIVLYSGMDGIVRCVDVYCGMTSRDDPRGVIPFGVVWRDGAQDVMAKLGAPFAKNLFREINARLYVYQAGNMMFSVGFDVVDECMMKYWRVRQMWREDFPDEE